MTPTGPCTGCGKPDSPGELIAGNLYTYTCAACDREAEDDWHAVVANIAEKIHRGDFDNLTACRHCGEEIAQDDRSGVWAHVIGPGSRLIRCDPEKSGQPYGLNATPPDDTP